MKSFLLKYLYFFSGIFISCIGNYFLILAKNLGVSPWDVFHLGISRYFPSLGLGTIGLIVGLLLLIPTSYMGIRPRFGTFLNIFSFGLILNILISSHLLNTPSNLFLSFVFLIIGVITTGVGTAFYLHANAGAGPRDALMLGLNNKTNLSIAQIRSSIEVIVVIIGYILGGPVGIGTLIYSLTIGFSVQLSMKCVTLLWSKNKPAFNAQSPLSIEEGCERLNA